MTNKNSNINTAISISSGCGAYYATKQASKLIQKAIIRHERARQTNLPEQIQQQIKQGIHYAEGKILTKDIKIYDMNICGDEVKRVEVNGYREYLNHKINNTKNPFQKTYLKLTQNQKVKEFSKHFDKIIKGENASYCMSETSPKIWINLKNFYAATFHELGHHIDFSNPKLKPLILKTKSYIDNIKPLAPVLLAISLLTPTKKERNSNGNIFTKSLDFIKNNSGKIMMIATLPLVATEYKANINGVKLAKKVLNSECLKHVKKNCLTSTGLYTIGLLTYGLSFAAAKATKNKVNEKLSNNN